jgi:hypothetical protein
MQFSKSRLLLWSEKDKGMRGPGRTIPRSIIVVATTTFVCVLQLLNARGRVRLFPFSSLEVSNSFKFDNVTASTLPSNPMKDENAFHTNSERRDSNENLVDGENEDVVSDDDQDNDDGYYADDDDSSLDSSKDFNTYGVPVDKQDTEYLEEKVIKKHNKSARFQPMSLQPPKPRESSEFVLSHVWSPYVVWRKQNETDDPYYPLDQAQNVTWGSMWRAKQYYERENPGGNLTIYCAILWMDVEVLQNHQPPLCQEDNTIILDRSTHTEYPDLEPPIHYPFINDILVKAGDEMDRYSTRRKNKKSSKMKYMVYTNSDIGVVEKFYTKLEKAIILKPSLHEAFQINRRTIVSEYVPLHQNLSQPLTSNDLELIEDKLIHNFTYHPGVDCFVIRKDILDGFDLGNLFLGQPPWAGVLKTILRGFMSTEYGEYSSKAGLTYHLGDDREWNSGGQNLTKTGKLPALQPCIFANKPHNGLWSEHRYQNTLNCAIISNGTKDFAEDNGPFPPFLRPNAYDRAMQVYRVRERERMIEKIKREEAAKRQNYNNMRKQAGK